jgi:PP-loop superfamily ATP-utilizing enzyme
VPSALSTLQAFEAVRISFADPDVTKARVLENVSQLRRHLGLADPLTPCTLIHGAEPKDWKAFDRCPTCGKQREEIIDEMKAARSG